ncbi:MAG: hypothetical protein QXS27_07850, partial [Candidatus Jordarchaeaceae archaeon]
KKTLRIYRLEPGNFIIQEEEKKPRGKLKGAKGGGKHKPQKVDQIQEARPNHCNHCGAQIPKTLKPRTTNQRTVVDLEMAEGSLTKRVTLWKVHKARCPNLWKASLRRKTGQRPQGPHPAATESKPTPSTNT